MYLLIGADFVPTKSNLTLFNNGDVKELFGDELLDLLKGADHKIFNLETPLADKDEPIAKQGPNLIAPTSTIPGYKNINTDIVALANNHIMDQGVQGLNSTINVLDAAGIEHFGAGDCLDEAKKPFIFTYAGKKAGIYACAEHEFSIATDTSAGANPFDPLWSPDHVAALKEKADHVTVLYHGGKEYYRYPSPNLQKTCRRLVDKGADLVICQHSHCIGCEEKYKDGTIVYGQGNFLFDHKDDNEYLNTGLLIRVDEDFSISYIPLKKHGNAIRLADREDADTILREFYDRSAEIQKEGFIEDTYSRFADEYLYRYLYSFYGTRSLADRILNRLSNGKYLNMQIRKHYDDRSVLRLRNYIECEAHRELLLKGLK
ncbi:MAG: CapA family protein [Lachnospiraceae bacterium]|nr:CapA family protein [Lachnospiraceae bacterium]